MAVIDGRRVPSAEVSGVLVRVQSVVASDLPWIRRDERIYVAGEMTAFLVAWIGSLGCCVLNRPKPPLLTHPVWGRERWLRTASRVGIPVVSTAPRDAAVGADRALTVIGDRCVGEADARLPRYARALARACGVDLLTCHFAGAGAAARFVAAEPSTPPGDGAVAEAVLRHLLDHPVRPAGLGSLR